VEVLRHWNANGFLKIEYKELNIHLFFLKCIVKKRVFLLVFLPFYLVEHMVENDALLLFSLCLEFIPID
jgi:hypothetical protein